MELSNIEIHSTACTDASTKLNSHSQEDTTQSTENYKIFATPNDPVKTRCTSLGATSITSNSKVTTDDVTVTGAAESTSETHLNKFSIKKYCPYVCLAFVILFAAAVVIVPVTLFHITSHDNPSFFEDADFEACSVRLYNLIIFKYSYSYTYNYVVKIFHSYQNKICSYHCQG